MLQDAIYDDVLETIVEVGDIHRGFVDENTLLVEVFPVSPSAWLLKPLEDNFGVRITDTASLVAFDACESVSDVIRWVKMVKGTNE